MTPETDPDAPPARATGATPDARQEIEAEHRLLRELVYRLRHTRDLRALVPQLDRLRALLVEHFAHEEGGDGLHAAVERTAPHKANQVDELFREHVEILAELDRLTAAAREYLEGPLADVLAGVREITTRLHEHERAETDLFAEAVTEDLGAGD
ncbi:MAG TPA: hemerythrin domain-containing protein [Thermoanaerobaculia bacterium]